MATSSVLSNAGTNLTSTITMTDNAAAQIAGIADSQHVVERLHRELKVLLTERATILKRIGVIKYTIAGLADVFGPEAVDEELRGLLTQWPTSRTPRSRPGFTEICRDLLKKSNQPLTARQLLVKMQEEYSETAARQRHPSAAVSVILRRLVNYGEATEALNENGVRTWLWAGSGQEREVSTEVAAPAAQVAAPHFL
jgi:hypothetical protein